MSDEIEDLVNKYAKTSKYKAKGVQKRGLPPEVKKQRVRERAARYQEAQRRARMYFQSTFKDEWYQKYMEYRTQIDEERGPLPGD